MNRSVLCLLAVAALLLAHTDATKLRKFRNRGVKRDFEAEEVMGSVQCQTLGVNPLSGVGIQSVGLGFQQSDVNFDGTLRGQEIKDFEKAVETMIECAEVDDRK
ncbi:uncharacterized protein [Littorina saxatilis]